MSRDISMPLAIDDIIIGDGRRDVDPAVVKRLADSIDGIGLRHPITVRRKGEQYILVAGRHRVEAFKKLERDHIPACIVSMTNAEARMWEIAENLHRSELTKLERAEQIDEWRSLVAQVGPPSQPAERGIRKTAEELGVSRQEVERSANIASIAPEAKEAAHEAGLDDNQSALLKVAAAPRSQQVATVHELVRSKADRVDGDVKVRAAQSVAEMIAEYVPGAAWDSIKSNLYAAGAANIANALTNITGEAIMDKRYQ